MFFLILKCEVNDLTLSEMSFFLYSNDLINKKQGAPHTRSLIFKFKGPHPKKFERVLQSSRDYA